MKTKLSGKREKSFFTRWKIFHHTKPLISWGILAGILLFATAVAGGVGYKFFDYAQHDPKFCTTCHPIMDEAYATWEDNEHFEAATCHGCHHLTPGNAFTFGMYTLIGMPSEVPEREESKVIVPDKHCMNCHWIEERQHGDAASEWLSFAFPHPDPPEEVNKVSYSRFHAIHYSGSTACITCHGKKRLHDSETEPHECLDCHENLEDKQHAALGVELACLNCHTDRTADLNPDRAKCLACHGENNIAATAAIEPKTLDLRYHLPPAETVAHGRKILETPTAPMQNLNCDSCHKPHDDHPLPYKDRCISCHPSVEDVGQHELHLKFFNGDCLQCHTQHEWEITEEKAQKECIRCHEYYEPVKFIQAKK